MVKAEAIYCPWCNQMQPKPKTVTPWRICLCAECNREYKIEKEIRTYYRTEKHSV